MNSTLYTPRLISLLPFVYVAWADGVLSPTEIKFLQEEITKLDYLSKEEIIQLDQWTNPKIPPEPRIFSEWLEKIKKYSASLPINEKNTLVNLGLGLANATTGEKNTLTSEQTKTALRKLELSLQLDHNSNSRVLFSHLLSDSELNECNVCNFEASDLQKVLDGKYAVLRNRVRKLLRDPYFKYQKIEHKEAYRLKILEWTKTLAKQGLSCYSFPKEYGGFAKGGDHIVIFEMLAYHDLSLTVKFGVQFGLFGGALYQLGTKKHHDLYLEKMHNAELLGCFAMTETGHGSNVKELETTATYDHSDQTITIHSPSKSARKEYIGNALHGQMAAVFAQLIVDGVGHGVHTILCPIKNPDGSTPPGVTIKDCGPKLGLNGVDNGKIWFDNVKVSVENLLNKYGNITEDGQYTSLIENPAKRFFTMLGALVVGRISVGIGSISVAKSALSIAIKYAAQRRQFPGKDEEIETLLLDYPTHRRRLFPLLAKTYAFHFAISDLREQYATHTGDDLRKIETLAAGLKAKASWHATKTVQECREACGGKGYLWENRFADLKADSDIFTTFEGDNTVLMQLVAKGVLTEFKQSFNDDGWTAVVNYLLSRASNRMDELNLVNRNRSSTAHLLHKNFHEEAFEYRYEKLLYNLSSKMRALLKMDIHPHEAFLKCQLDMMDLADAYMDLVTLTQFVKCVRSAPNPELKSALMRLEQLYALTTIGENRGWYLENDYMRGAKTEAISRLCKKLCDQIQVDALAYCNAFGIPDEVLGAEIIQ